MAKYRYRSCPKCKDYLGVVVPEPPEPVMEVPIDSRCLRCGFKLLWKVILGNKPVLTLLWIVTFIFALCSSANTQEKKVKAEPLYKQLIRGVARIEEHQSLCTPGRDWAKEQNVSLGSGFFVIDRRKDEADFYLVTARHVVKGRADVFAHIHSGSQPTKFAYLRLPKDLWVFHPSNLASHFMPIDVAVMRIEQTDFIRSFLYCPSPEQPFDCGTHKRTKKALKNQLISSPEVMDRAIFFGFPEGVAASGDIEPFARAGVVAYTAPTPALRIGRKRIIKDAVYYLDAPSFGGNSGGPVMREPLPLVRGGIQLWGLVTGSNVRGRDYTIVTRLEKITETIEHARSVARLNEESWSATAPVLPIRCEADTSNP